MKIQLLGAPAVRLPNHLTPTFKTTKGEGLFYYLAVTRQPHIRVQLATLFWGDMPEKNARVSLSKALSDLREQVGEYVTIATQTILFNTTLPYDLDIERFLTPPSSVESVAALQVRTELYRGAFLDGFYVRDAPDFEGWLRGERERFHNHAVQLLSTLAARYEQGGQIADAMNTLRRLLRVEPWREEAHYHLMTLLAQQGEIPAALRQYERCRAALADELDVAPGEAITKLYRQLRATGQAPAAMPAPFAVSLPSPTSGQPKPIANLPRPPTLFVGRAGEIKALADRLQEPACRLLTLIGPGGIGKTRLALEVARQLIDRSATTPNAPAHFPEGIFFVDLMPIDSAAGMVAAMAEAVGFTFYSNTPPQQQLFNYLKARKLLLLLDNFEHLCPESSLVAELLAAAPGVKMMVTSRDALPLQSAYLHLIQGLDYAAEQPAADATATDAVRLFVQCAQRHQATFALATNLTSVTQICRMVGGLPLALELAATWLRTLSCTQIAQELEKGVTLLRANLLDLPERHRDMRMVFEQTWQRLTLSEAAVMERLALFRGGFTLAAAEAVAGASIPIVAALAERALIRLDESGRYQIHELVRQFATEKLSVGKVQVETVAAAHARFFLDLAAQQKTNLTDRHQQAALATLQADVDNLRTAWFWALQQPDLLGIAEATDSLYQFFRFTCRYSEGKELFATSADLLETLSAAEILISMMMTRAAVFAYHLGEYEQPLQHFRTLLTNPADHSQRDIAIAYTILGQIAGWQGRDAEAEQYLRQSVDLHAALGDQGGMAAVLHGMAEMYAHAWTFQKAVDCAQACLDIGLRLGRDDLSGSGHYTLGYAYKSLGHPKRALHHYQQGCVYTERTGDRLSYALSVGGVGIELCNLGQKQWAQGFALIQQSLSICQELGHQVHVITRIFSLAVACIHGRRYAEAIPFAQECVHQAKAANLGRGIALGICTLGEAYYFLGDFAMSRLHLQQAVPVAIDHTYAGLSHITVVYSLLLEKEAAHLPPIAATQNHSQAVTLATAALQRRAWHVYHRKAKQLCERLQAQLTCEQFVAAQALADQQPLEALATQIIGLDHDQVIG